MSRSKNLITMLTRYPRLGEVKTRLVPPLPPEEALDLHDRLTRHTLRTMLAVQATGDAKCQVRTDAAFTHAAHEWLGGGFSTRYQGEGDLGDRIRIAFGDGFSAGKQKVVVVGSDCPRLTSAHLRDALRRLDGVDVVLGPATDGGYYLIALRKETAKRAVPFLFSNVPWSTAEVLDATIELAEKHDLSYVLLEPLPDVDCAEDLADAELVLRASASASARVTAVIPALNEATLVGTAVAGALAAGVDEVIVADGGSRDDTCAVASAAGARVIESAPGRALQMNAGAAEVTDGILLLTHADTRLPQDAAALAREALARPGVVAGAFSFAVPAGTRHERLIGTAGRLRHRISGTPYGDQALFLSAGTFGDMGGYPEIPTMEDLEIVLRLRRLGTVVVLPQRAETSARVWEEHGLVVPTLVNLLGTVAYRLGADPDLLASWRLRIAPRSRRTGGRSDGGGSNGDRNGGGEGPR